jgi:putative two-component system response regulator
MLTLVDDEPMVLDMLVQAARSWHYECQVAHSAEEALEVFDARPTPVLVTDLNMPGQGGVWLVREVHRRWPLVAIIVVTAGRDTDAAVECLNAGAHRYFQKPIRLDEFRHALEMTMWTYQLQREHERYHRHLESTVRRQTRQLRRTFLSAINSLIRTMEARDPYTTGHSLRVRQLSLDLADTLGLDNRLRKQLSLAAKLHDIGKAGIPEAILNKPDTLTAEEFLVVKEHPQIGERILAPIIRSPAILAAIRSHHECLDGSGYPDGLLGERIPLLARLITVADCFDALTSSRAYRGPMPISQALEVLRAGAGKQFEPEFVRAFVEMATTMLLPKVTPSAHTAAGWHLVAADQLSKLV